MSYPRVLRMMLVVVAVAFWPEAGYAQTVEGDILRGQGAFAAGAGWYNLNTARANAINVQAMRNYNEEVRLNYANSIRYWTEKDQKRKLSKEEAKKRATERMKQISENPTTDDIRNGDALNMLAVALTSPEINQQDWYTKAVPLPNKEIVKDVVFVYFPNRMAQNELKIDVALSRVSNQVDWPLILTDEVFNDERIAYEQTVSKVKNNVMKGKFELAEMNLLDKALDGLLKEITKTYGSDKRGYLTSAKAFHSDLKSATKLFDGAIVDYSRELFSETEEYDAKSVGELVAFMLKYRLFFAKADTPRANELYNVIYAAMKEQARVLNAKPPQFDEPESTDSSVPATPVAASSSSSATPKPKSNLPEIGQNYYLENRWSGKMVLPNGHANNKELGMAPTIASGRESEFKFRLVDSGEKGYVYIIHPYSGKLIANNAEAKPVFFLWGPIPKGHEDRYKFKITEASDGFVKIQHKASGKYCATGDRKMAFTAEDLAKPRHERYQFRFINAP